MHIRGAFILMLLGAAAVGAQGQAYAFGTAQIHEKIDMELGSSYTTPIHFYNTFGDRTTHVFLSGVGCVDAPGFTKCPPGANTWVDIKPKPEARSYRHPTTDEVCNLTENFAVEPRFFVEKATNATPPPGWSFIQSPSRQDSWIPTRAVEVTFTVPPDTPLGTYKFVTSSTGSWIPDNGCKVAGGAVLTQARGFEYEIKVKRPTPKEGFREELVTPTPPSTPTPRPPPSPLENPQTQMALFAVVVVAVAGGMFVLGRRGRR